MRKRIISAIVMLMIFIPVLLLGDVYYALFGGIIGLLSLYELMRLEKNIPFVMKIISYISLLVIIFYSYCNGEFKEIININIIIGLFLVYSLSLIINGNLKKYNYRDSLWLFCITLMIGIMYKEFINIRLININYVIYCFVIAILTDTFALFGGKIFGKHKLSKEVSPNKTVEGSICGSIVGTIGGCLFFSLAIKPLNVYIILITLVLSVLGQFGDLFFSSIKRYYGIKDYSNLIPGHGGILDRSDSVLFVIMGFVLFMTII